ncbi:LINE-1 reverse transcriptase like, partial [Trifolium medium]|nr:LINE-1 reverse transcriptase like [Trifolium medium]
GLGVTEAVREGGRKQSHKKKGGLEERLKTAIEISSEDISGSVYKGVEGTSLVPDSQIGLNMEVVLPGAVITPSSGIELLLGGYNETHAHCETQQNCEASKLLKIQKQVGFCFDEEDGDVIKVLAKDELRDRAKKAEWEQRNLDGASGGILSIWGKSNSNSISTFNGEDYVGVCVEWGVLKTLIFVVNVYSKCDLLSKRRLWNNILMSKGSLGSGNWFTWFHASGRSMSRIDRMLASPELLEVLGGSSVWVLPRDVSDHCPLILKPSNNDWGPKPFRFNNYWLLHKNFKKVVEDGWKEQQVSGWMGFVLKEKLRGLKIKLK